MTPARDPGRGPSRGSQELLAPIQGLHGNLGRFAALLLQVFFVGAMVGVERTILPLLATQRFGLVSKTAVLTFILAFGLAKAPGNLLAGRLADRYGRRRVLILGWSLGLPVPLLIALAPSWGWVIAANALLGAQQALCWSTSIFMKVDVAGSRHRGLAIGLNEGAGYLGTAVLAYATGAIAATHGARVAPFLLGELIAVAGWLSAYLYVADTTAYLEIESSEQRSGTEPVGRRIGFVRICQAGLVTKLADVVAWGLLPLYFSARGLSITTVGILAAGYPLSWALLQPLTGAVSDRAGRRELVAAGMLGQAAGLLAIAAGNSALTWFAGVVILGAGTAMVYPVLLAAAGDSARPHGRASSIGLYRFWRDLGFVAGALGAGLAADAFGTAEALRILAVVAFVSMLFILLDSGGRGGSPREVVRIPAANRTDAGAEGPDHDRP